MGMFSDQWMRNDEESFAKPDDQIKDGEECFVHNMGCKAVMILVSLFMIVIALGIAGAKDEALKIFGYVLSGFWFLWFLPTFIYYLRKVRRSDDDGGSVTSVQSEFD